MYMCVLVHVHVTTGIVPVYVLFETCITSTCTCIHGIYMYMTQFKDVWLFHIDNEGQ